MDYGCPASPGFLLCSPAGVAPAGSSAPSRRSRPRPGNQPRKLAPLVPAAGTSVNNHLRPAEYNPDMADSRTTKTFRPRKRPRRTPHSRTRSGGSGLALRPYRLRDGWITWILAGGMVDYALRELGAQIVEAWPLHRQESSSQRRRIHSVRP